MVISSAFLFFQNPVDSGWMVLFTIFFYRISTAKQIGVCPRCHTYAFGDMGVQWFTWRDKKGN